MTALPQPAAARAIPYLFLLPGCTRACQNCSRAALPACLALIFSLLLVPGFSSYTPAAFIAEHVADVTAPAEGCPLVVGLPSSGHVVFENLGSQASDANLTYAIGMNVVIQTEADDSVAYASLDFSQLPGPAFAVQRGEWSGVLLKQSQRVFALTVFFSTILSNLLWLIM